jgi:hypothetical protein
MEGERLVSQAKVQENSARGLKERLLWFMGERDVRKVETDKFRFSVAKNGGQLPLVIDDQGVPDDYLVVEHRVDKEKIRDCLKDGGLLSFAKFGERGEHLRIK